jgi:hypothetical protein
MLFRAEADFEWDCTTVVQFIGTLRMAFFGGKMVQGQMNTE